MAEAQGKINQYVCEQCRKPTTTVNAVAGTTPFLLCCRQPGCTGMARSEFYRVPQDLVPTHEWYRPVGKELVNLDSETLDHVARGGLLIRKLDPIGREKMPRDRIEREAYRKTRKEHTDA